MSDHDPVHIGLDGTPLLGPRTGVGRYTGELLAELASGAPRAGDRVTATAFTVRGVGDLRSAVPPGVDVRSRPVPARLLRASWLRAEVPPVSWLAGRVDVFHATNFVLPPVGRAAGVVTVHDLSFLRTRGSVGAASRAYRELVPRSIRRAEVVLTPSQAVADEVLAEYGLDPGRVTATALGVSSAWTEAGDPEPASPSRDGLPDDYIVAVGTLEPRKNLQTLVDAFDRLLRSDPDAPDLVLVGPPGWGSALDLARLPTGRVHLTGFLQDDDLRRTVAGSRGLAFPSLYEGFGLPPLEALACGRPVVVSDLPVMREVLGEQATYVPVGDVDALAGALQRLPARADDAPGAVAARRQHAAAFTWARCAGLTRRAYETALSAR
jgi:glycosyltransferase involved in cell wall biosynthesis